MATASDGRTGLQVTQLGWAVAVAGIGGLAGGFLLGWFELTVIGVGCITMWLIALASVIGGMDLGIERNIAPTRVTVGESCTATVSVTNSARRTRRRLVLHDLVSGREPGGDQAVPLALPPVRPGTIEQVTYPLPTDRRGSRQVGPVRVVRADPLGLVRRQRSTGGERGYRVWPRRVGVGMEASSRLVDPEGSTSAHAQEGGLAFHTIREYRPGDDARLIHWRSTAKTGGQSVLVRQFVDNRRPQQLIVLDLDVALEPAGLETAIEVAASLVESCHTGGVTHLLHLLDGAEVSTELDTSLDRLADATRPASAPSPGGLARSISPMSSSEVSLALVTGPRSVGEVLEMTESVPAASIDIVRVVGTPGPIQLLPPRTRIIEIDSLDQFRRSWPTEAR